MRNHADALGLTQGQTGTGRRMTVRRSVMLPFTEPAGRGRTS
jgi:hypothetical protein